MRKLFNDALQKIGDHPHLGQEREDLTEKSVRFWPVHRSYMVIYDTNTTPVNILRIYNSARDVGILLTQ